MGLCRALLPLLPALATAVDIYVASTGRDTNSGTSPKDALATLARARDLARASATVHVAAGTYRLKEPLRLSAAHGGVRWRGEGGASISGGALVTGWRPASAPAGSKLAVVSADAQPAGAGPWTRQLFVNGRRARRARLPERNASALFAGAKLVQDGYLLASARVNPLRPGSEMVFPKSTSPWTEPRCAVAEANATFVAMMQPCWINLLHKPCNYVLKGAPTGNTGYVENVGPESLASPGDWAFDTSTSTLHYALRPGEVAESLQAVLPVLETLLAIDGAADVRFEGFTFEHATWLRPGQGEGYVEHQAGNCLIGRNNLSWDCDKSGAHNAMPLWSQKPPGNIAVTNSSGIDFIRCEFTRLGGGAALDFTRSQHCRVADSYFHSISGAAVQIGSFDDPRATTDRNVSVSNSIVNGTGEEFSGTVGITVGYTQGVAVWGNDVSNTGFSAISVGWGWNRHPCWNCTFAADNVVAYNRVHDYKLRMADGGGIYMLGPQNRSIVHSNWVYDMMRDGGNGLYPDEGTAYATLRGNVVFNISNFWLFLWTGSIHDVLVEGNFWDNRTKTFDAGSHCPLVNNTPFNNSFVPKGARRIMAAAGVNASNPWLPRAVGPRPAPMEAAVVYL